METSNAKLIGLALSSLAVVLSAINLVIGKSKPRGIFSFCCAIVVFFLNLAFYYDPDSDGEDEPNAA
jgi:hypothetical protein